MRFTALTISALFMSSAYTLAVPEDEIPKGASVKAVSLRGEFVNGELVNYQHSEAAGETESKDLGKRVLPALAPVGVAILKTAGTAAVTKLTEVSMDAAIKNAQRLVDWDREREAYTVGTTENMWKKNVEGRKGFVAAVCYNKGYSLKYPQNVDGKVVGRVKRGLLSTDYDCMYLKAPNAFWTHHEGGHINLAYVYDSRRCHYDSKTGDLTCN